MTDPIRTAAPVPILTLLLRAYIAEYERRTEHDEAQRATLAVVEAMLRDELAKVET